LVCSVPFPVSEASAQLAVELEEDVRKAEFVLWLTSRFKQNHNILSISSLKVVIESPYEPVFSSAGLIGGTKTTSADKLSEEDGLEDITETFEDVLFVDEVRTSDEEEKKDIIEETDP
jgi:hypothetical protein